MYLLVRSSACREPEDRRSFSRWEDVFHCLITVIDLCYHKWMYLNCYSFLCICIYIYFSPPRKNVSMFTPIFVFVLWSIVAGKLFSFLCLQALRVFDTIYIPCGTIILIFSLSNLMNSVLRTPEVLQPIAVYFSLYSFYFTKLQMLYA